MLTASIKILIPAVRLVGSVPRGCVGRGTEVRKLTLSFFV